MLKKWLMIPGLIFTAPVFANNVEIVHVTLIQQYGTWRADVTLKHADTGWDHYADEWRLVDAKGKELAKRILYHPHVNEQPFTRSLTDFYIPKDRKIIFVEAHDKVHGWSPAKIQIDMTRSAGDKYDIQNR